MKKVIGIVFLSLCTFAFANAQDNKGKTTTVKKSKTQMNNLTTVSSVFSVTDKSHGGVEVAGSAARVELIKAMMERNGGKAVNILKRTAVAATVPTKKEVNKK